jgi:hypothetical protein
MFTSRKIVLDCSKGKIKSLKLELRKKVYFIDILFLTTEKQVESALE